MQSKKKRQLVEETILSSYESMYRIAFTYVKNQEDALDIVQDSACRVPHSDPVRCVLHCDIHNILLLQSSQHCPYRK